MKHIFILTVDADRDMGLDDPNVVKDLIEEAIRSTGIDNCTSIKIELWDGS
jgi:hypothetical protein